MHVRNAQETGSFTPAQSFTVLIRDGETEYKPRGEEGQRGLRGRNVTLSMGQEQTMGDLKKALFQACAEAGKPLVSASTHVHPRACTYARAPTHVIRTCTYACVPTHKCTLKRMVTEGGEVTLGMGHGYTGSHHLSIPWGWRQRS